MLYALVNYVMTKTICTTVIWFINVVNKRVARLINAEKDSNQRKALLGGDLKAVRFLMTML